MKTIKNFELKIKRTAVGESVEPYGAAITDPASVRRVAQLLIGDSAEEHFIVVMLDIKNRVIGYTEAARGSIDGCAVDLRTVFRAAIAVGASNIVCSHNHPSGDATPSAEDLRLTERVKAAGQLLGIAVLDHVIVTDTSTVSLYALGKL